MSDDVAVIPCEDHASLNRMREWNRVVQIATDCVDCVVE